MNLHILNVLGQALSKLNAQNESIESKHFALVKGHPRRIILAECSAMIMKVTNE